LGMNSQTIFHFTNEILVVVALQVTTVFSPFLLKQGIYPYRINMTPLTFIFNQNPTLCENHY
jgi:hypothetical protein